MEPAADDPRAVPYTCQDCNGVFYRWKRKSRLTCPDCSAVRGVAAVESMRHKSGPAYEKGALRQLAYWTSEVERLGLVVPPPPAG